MPGMMPFLPGNEPSKHEKRLYKSAFRFCFNRLAWSDPRRCRRCDYDFDVKDGYEHFVCARSAGDRGPGLSFGHESIEDALEFAQFEDFEREQIFFGNWTRDYNQLICPQLLKTPGESPGLGMCGQTEATTSSGTTGHVLLGFDLGQFSSAFNSRLADGFLSRTALTAIIKVLAEAKFVNSGKSKGISVNKQRQIFDVTEQRLGVYRPEEHIDNPAGLEDGRCKDSDLHGPVLPADLEIDPATGMKRFIASQGSGSSYDLIESYFTEAVRLGRNPDGLRYFGMGLHILEDFFCHTNFVEICLFKLGHRDVILWSKPEPADRVPMTSGIFGFADTVVSILYEISHHLVQAADCQQPWERTTGQKILLIIMREKSLAWGDRLDALWTSMEEFKEDHPDFFQGTCKAREFLFGWASDALGKLLEQITGLIDDIQTFADSEDIAEPTHSQMSKDHDVHPLHVLAATLAKKAVGEVGKSMMTAYEGNGSFEEVMAAVTKHMTHPQDTQWMETIVSEWAEANPDDVARAADRRWLGEQAQKRYQQIEDETQKMLDEARKQAEIMQQDDQWLNQQLIAAQQQAQQYSAEVIKLQAQLKEQATGLEQEMRQLSSRVQQHYRTLKPKVNQLSEEGLEHYNSLTRKIPTLFRTVRQQYTAAATKIRQMAEHPGVQTQRLNQKLNQLGHEMQARYKALKQEVQHLQHDIDTRYQALKRELGDTDEIRDDTIHDYNVIKEAMPGIMLQEIHGIEETFKDRLSIDEATSDYYDKILEHYFSAKSDE